MSDYFTREQLEAMSDEELYALEDELLLANETTAHWSIRPSAGRMVTMVLVCIFWYPIFALPLSAITRWSGAMHAPVQIMWVVISGMMAVGISSLLWTMIGRRLRFLIRNMLHYWPVTLVAASYLLAMGLIIKT